MSARRGTVRATLAVVVAVVATKLSLAGCSDVGSYIYSGEQYDPTLECLEPVSSIDVIAGNGAGACGPVCILSLPEDGGQIAYVSTMCPPYPVYPFETDASTQPLCVAALGAFWRGALCEDGGVVITGDAGSDATADATIDSGAPSVDGLPATDSGPPDAASTDGATDTGTAPSDATAG